MSKDALRLDKWLWYARLFKSRTMATRLCAAGRLRANGTIVRKANHGVHPGDVLTFPQGPHIRVIRVLALGTRRGPAAEARELYEDLDPPQARRSGAPGTAAETAGERPPGSGRPTKAERRAIDRLHGSE